MMTEEEYDTDGAFNACYEQEKGYILDALEQGDSIENIIRAIGGGNIARQVVEAVLEALSMKIIEKSLKLKVQDKGVLLLTKELATAETDHGKLEVLWVIPSTIGIRYRGYSVTLDQQDFANVIKDLIDKMEDEG